MVFVTSDPIVTGQTLNIARPGGFVTGVTTLSVDIAAKKVALLREAVPKLARLALANDGSPGGARQCEGMTAAAEQLGLESKVFTMDEPAGFAPGFEAIAAQGWQAVAAVSSPLFTASARADRQPHRQAAPASLVRYAGVRAGRRPDVLRPRPAGRVPSSGRDDGAHRPRRQAALTCRSSRRLPSVFAFNQTTAKALGLSLSLPVMASVDELVE